MVIYFGTIDNYVFLFMCNAITQYPTVLITRGQSWEASCLRHIMYMRKHDASQDRPRVINTVGDQ